ncbi:MAG TPA: MFS transporter, partial [Gaiellaceae bacterium]|nr:MFS transporter [Gaiellaceae bacterium]
YLALPWFVLVTTGSPGKMSLVLAAEIAPMAVLGIPSGMLVERIGSRKTMLIADFARAPILASIPLLHATGMLSFGLLLGVVALLGCFMPPYFASQRTILPELVGEDERLMSQGNSLIEGGAGFAALIGPAAAGMLIPFIGASNVLYVDAATYLVAFLLVLTFVPRRKPVVVPARQKALAGVRFLLGDKLLGPLAAVVVGFGLVMPGIAAGLPVYAFDAFDGNARIAGLFYAALGAGALVGSLLAVVAVRKVAPLRLSAFAMLAFAVPLWVLPFLPPWPVVFAALFAAMLCTPLINGPLIAVLTSRTPDGLRAMTITAVISLNTLAAPLGFLVAGQVLEHWGVVPLFTAVVAGVTWMAIAYGAIVLRNRDVDAPVADQLAV